MGKRAFEMLLGISVSEAGAGMTCGVGKQRWPDQNALTRSKLWRRQDRIGYKIQEIYWLSAVCWGESNSAFPETEKKKEEGKGSKKVCGNVKGL